MVVMHSHYAACREKCEKTGLSRTGRVPELLAKPGLCLSLWPLDRVSSDLM